MLMELEESLDKRIPAKLTSVYVQQFCIYKLMKDLGKLRLAFNKSNIGFL